MWAKTDRQGDTLSTKTFFRESQRLRDEARKLYERLLAEHPRYARNDEVLFNLAYLVYEDGPQAPSAH